MPKAVILAGGQGERFWPLTHEKFPKYRIRLDGKKSLLVNTYERLGRFYKKNDIFVVTTKAHKPLIQKELPTLKKENIFIEPARRNTAAAIYLSTALIQAKYGPDEVVTFFPADHLIQTEALFSRALHAAVQVAAKKDCLVTLGVKPTFPATGFGYIESGAPMSGLRDAYQVARFTEKPIRRTAQKYIKKGNFYWNVGIFSWRTQVFIETFKRYCPEMHEVFNIHKIAASYKKFPKLSIDYALLEKADNMALIRTSMDWCDMGNWDMFLKKAQKDKRGNLVMGRAAHLESKDSLVVNYDERPIFTIGIKDLVVVQSKQGILICRSGLAEKAAYFVRNGCKT